MKDERRIKKSEDKKKRDREREGNGTGLIIIGRLLVMRRKMRERILMPAETSTRQEHAMQSLYGEHNWRSSLWPRWGVR